MKEVWGIERSPIFMLNNFTLTNIMYKPYSPEWHRYRYLKEAIDKYLDDYVDNDVIMRDILNIVCDRQEAAHAEYHRLEDLELKLRE